MEKQEKPRVSYADFVATQKSAAHEEYSVSWAIQWFIRAMNGWNGKPPVKELGKSHLLTLRRIQRSTIGKKDARKLTEQDVIEHCEWRRESVCAATINQDITYMHGALKYVKAAPGGCKQIQAHVIQDVKPFLVKNGYIGKSTPRERRPTPEETAILLDYFAKGNAWHTTKVDMVLVTRWQLASSRRIGETCALLWEDWNRENHTILVRKMKDPRNKNKQKVVALPEEAQAMLEELWPLRNTEEPRIFPYEKKTCSARYTIAKKELRKLHPGLFENLRLHDSRRDCGTRLVEDKGFSPAEAILFTGHETVAVFERTYLKQKPELVKDGPRALRLAAS